MKETVHYNALRRWFKPVGLNWITTIWATPKSRNDTEFFRLPENDLTLRVLCVLRERLNHFISPKNKVFIAHQDTEFLIEF